MTKKGFWKLAGVACILGGLYVAVKKNEKAQAWLAEKKKELEEFEARLDAEDWDDEDTNWGCPKNKKYAKVNKRPEETTEEEGGVPTAPEQDFVKEEPVENKEEPVENKEEPVENKEELKKSEETL